ncbi:hypothetical protein AXF42_Ash015542 [Apostasia shenzhenica]|uniref:Uncharacterized protein n=1 Tax=Apostasia shenzhenica TaxID=1088818 RepID=A0A2I0AKI9_9ASPA|nr:hypothetical protein AXF42_Ash015542 [Apostasia shenzhenica]
MYRSINCSSPSSLQNSGKSKKRKSHSVEHHFSEVLRFTINSCNTVAASFQVDKCRKSTSEGSQQQQQWGSEIDCELRLSTSMDCKTMMKKKKKKEEEEEGSASSSTTEFNAYKELPAPTETTLSSFISAAHMTH